MPEVRPQRFAYLANAICRGERSGTPTPQPPSSPAMLRAYARGALPVAQQISMSLQRLGAQSGRLRAIAPLLLDYHALVALYSAAGGANGSGVSASSIAAAQQKTAAAAQALNVPLCAPAAPAGY